MNPSQNDFNTSYWEKKQYFSRADLAVIGSGIVGLSTAITYAELHPSAKVLVLEKGWLPEGASTKNAGFACFGSAGELLADLQHMPHETVWNTVKMRIEGLSLLRRRLSDPAMGFDAAGGYELFRTKEDHMRVADRLTELNRHIESISGYKDCFTEDARAAAQFKGIYGCIRNNYEGQIDTGAMMHHLIRLAWSKNIAILNDVNVESVEDEGNVVTLRSDRGAFTASKVVVAVNGFAGKLAGLKEVKPARAQVLVTTPVERLTMRGTFHMDEGFYYFRNIDGRVLLGGGRHLDMEAETTTAPDINQRIQDALDGLLADHILPGRSYKVEMRWTGIMGMGSEKLPVIRHLSPNVIAAVRMGGMGIAIGSKVAEKAVELMKD